MCTLRLALSVTYWRPQGPFRRVQARPRASLDLTEKSTLGDDSSHGPRSHATFSAASWHGLPRWLASCVLEQRCGARMVSCARRLVLPALKIRAAEIMEALARRNTLLQRPWRQHTTALCTGLVSGYLCNRPLLAMLAFCSRLTRRPTCGLNRNYCCWARTPLGSAEVYDTSAV